MPRHVLEEAQIHPTVRDAVSASQRAIVDEVKSAIAGNDVVVVGMAMNPYPRKTRALLDGAGVPYKYLGYGSYLSDWRRRNALKMWTGWPTFPMVFVKGQFVGGFADVKRLVASGELTKLLS